MNDELEKDTREHLQTIDIEPIDDEMENDTITHDTDITPNSTPKIDKYNLINTDSRPNSNTDSYTEEIQLKLKLFQWT